MVGFILEEMQRRIQDGFRILLPMTDAVRMFGVKLKLFYIEAVPKANHQPRLILNLSEKPYEGTPSVIDTTDREVAQKLTQFGRSFPSILQEIWEADLVQGPTWVSNIEVTDAYHRGILRMSQVGEFMYVIPLALVDKGCIIYIDLVLPIGWVD